MSSPESPIAKKDLRLDHDGNPKRPITRSRRTLQLPRLQTQVHSPQDLRNAVESALHYDGFDPSTSGHVTPSFLPFSGNFVLDATFTLPNGIEPLFDKVRKLDQSQKTDCAQVAQQLLYLIEEVDGFSYVRQGNGSQLHGPKTVMGWYFHYVCDASREHFPENNNIGNCKGSIYVSISTERIYIYYTHLDLHEPSTPNEALPGINQPPPSLKYPPTSPTITSSIILPPYESPQSSSRNTPLLPELNILPKIHPTPVDIDDSVHRNHLKLGALRDLVDSWLPEDGVGADGETKINPFLQMTFRFMVEWFESSMGHPKVQREIYKILDLENTTDGEGVVGYDTPSSAAQAPASKRTQDPRSPKPKLSLGVPQQTRRSIRDLSGLGYGTMLSPIVEDPVKQPPGEKRKSSSGSQNAGEKKKNKTGS